MTFWQKLRNGIANFLLQGLPSQDPTFEDQKRWYAEFNKKYFGDALPKNIRFQLVGDDEILADVYGGKKAPYMRFNPRVLWNTNHVRILLLHEMAHMAVWPKRSHGREWQEVMNRLWEAGAFRGLV